MKTDNGSMLSAVLWLWGQICRRGMQGFFMATAVCVVAVGLVRCADLPQGYAGQLDGNGGMRVAHGVTLA